MRGQVSASDLRHRIAIERDVRTPDGGGGAEVAWQLVAEVWAAIWPRTASEQLESDRAAGTATHDIWIRYRPDVTPQMRIAFGNRIFNIRGVLDMDGKRRWLKCVSEERDL